MEGVPKAAAASCLQPRLAEATILRTNQSGRDKEATDRPNFKVVPREYVEGASAQ